ncbi:MAG: tetratricopeptide repeat protein, partial [Promethearchaeota archaeon]
MSSGKNESKLNIKEMFGDNQKLTFLVGAGVSFEAPSQLPSPHEFMKTIIKYICTPSEIQNLIDTKYLRFENLIEIVRDIIDHDLNLLDFYSECDKPNIEHFFLAEMIKKGNFVVTTNFDYLIEYALSHLDIQKKKIIPVITEKDYEKFNDPEKLFKNGKMPVVKIHGSPKNIITGEDTRDSFINTIKLLGLNLDQNNIIQLEPFKAKLLENVSNERSLVIFGYSGKNDFDVLSTIKVMKNLKNIVWINHLDNGKDSEEIYRVDLNLQDSLKNLDEIDKMLLSIKQFNNSVDIYRINTNTSKLLEKFVEDKQNISSEKFSFNLQEWIKKVIKEPDELSKLYISSKIYYESKRYSDALRCLERLFRKADDREEDLWKAISLLEIGVINRDLGNYEKALEWFRKSLQVQFKTKNVEYKVKAFKNIGLIYHAIGNYKESHKYLTQALKDNEKVKDLSAKVEILNNLGLLYQSRENYIEALKNFEASNKLSDKLQNLKQKAISLKCIGKIYHIKENYSEALKYFNEALQIDELLENLEEKAEILNIIGFLYHETGNSLLGIEKCNEALRIFERLQLIEGKLESLNNLGIIFRDQWNYRKALEHFEEAYQIAERKELTDLEAKYANEIGIIFRSQDKYNEALEWLDISLNIYDQIGDTLGKVEVLENMGHIYKIQRDYTKALSRFDKVLDIFEQVNDQDKKATTLNTIGLIHLEQRNYNEALKNFENTLEIFEETENIEGSIETLSNLGYYYQEQGYYPEALRRYQDALD